MQSKRDRYFENWLWGFLANTITPQAKKVHDSHADSAVLSLFCSYRLSLCVCLWLCLLSRMFSILNKRGRIWKKTQRTTLIVSLYRFAIHCLKPFFFSFLKRIAHILPSSGFIHGTTYNVASTHKTRASLSIAIHIAWAQKIRTRYKYHYCWLTRSLVQQNHYSIFWYTAVN